MPISKLRPAFTFTEDRLRELQAVVPEAFADGKINWDTLREALGEALEDETKEHFGLFWPGKREARGLAALPSKGTLIPQPGQGVDEENTHNLFIEGDNLEVLKLLQKSYSGRVKMVYIDPPYNTGNDYIYIDDYSEPLDSYLDKLGLIDEAGDLLSTNTMSGGRYHTNWLNMILPRLLLARQFLSIDGSIFISIDNHEIHHLKSLMNDVFGEENFVAELVWEGALKNDSRFVSISHDYVVCYAKNIQHLKENSSIWRTRKEGLEEIYETVEALKKEYKSDYSKISEGLQDWYQENGKTHPSWAHKHYSKVDEKGVYFPSDISWPGGGGPSYQVLHPVTKTPVKVPARGWVFPNKDRMQYFIEAGKVEFGEDENKVPTLKRYLHETEGQVLPSVIYKDRRASMKRLRTLFGVDIFENPKDEEVLAKFIEAATSENDLIMDFFSGSCSTAHAVLLLNRLNNTKRNFICVQIPEPVDPKADSGKNALKLNLKTISEVGQERIRRTIKQLKKEGGVLSNEDLGFRSFSLLQSHFREWKNFEGKDSAQLQLRLEQSETPLVEGWQPENLLVETLLIQGFPLDSRVRSLPEFKANEVKQVTSECVAHHLYICLDKKVKAETVAKINLRPEDILVCLDSALSDEATVKLADQCNLKVI